MLSSVNCSLVGYIQSQQGLRFIQDRNCIVRRKNELIRRRVKLISGGGSGHEPAHIGYVGKGMLDGAVCGDVFCSPSAESIVDCLRCVAEPHEDVLFIVNNYTGDRLNFGLAVEKAQSLYGYRNVKILLNDDDCSIDESLTRKSVGKRGLAGCVLLIKILGAMSDLGYAIDDLEKFGSGLLQSGSITTFGFTFNVVDNRLNNIELGKGFHGEPGLYKLDSCDDFAPIIRFMIDKICKKITPPTDVVVLVNNLGGTSEFVMGVFVNTLCTILEQHFRIRRVYTGVFFSSLSQTGLSVTLLNLAYSEQLFSFLDYEVQVGSSLFGGSMNFSGPISEVQVIKDSTDDTNLSSTVYKLKFQNRNQRNVRNIIEKIAQKLLSSRSILNTYDKECGDGDTGNTIANGAMALLRQLDQDLDLLHPAKMLQDISNILLLSIGGTSGGLYSLFFQAASMAFVEADDEPAVTVKHWLEALRKGNEAIMWYALTEEGDRTMLDPLKQAEASLQSLVDRNRDAVDCCRIFAETCEAAARATQHMVPKSGRASYSATESKNVNYNHPDPGSHAVAIWARVLHETYRDNLP
ncbi:triokinase/FMN cyclase-like [Toxorhynchites rutilus septentrionalis]|uniref:triokinase/FMN cyclase-like n=1 Tax=Toxorhynchites rutilus septentrionalis TaxID=329112 RepID=UPI002479DF8D|nr:triokinase/FMN cyclase-like [Toxorhynchites rutilus septentrionalis]